MHNYHDRLPAWAIDVLATPASHEALTCRDDGLFTSDGAPVARIEQGVVRCSLPSGDASLDFYNTVGGAHFHERSQVPLAMTTLDTPIYLKYLARLRQGAETGLVVDVGGGDGRNAWPWLEWGHRIVVVDPVFAALQRLRQRVASHNPAWLDRLLLVEADARSLPLRTGCFDRLLTVETLAYLNEDYAEGLSECVRVVKPQGRLMVSDRDFEGGLVMQMFYFGGLPKLLQVASSRDIWDGRPDLLVRSRSFTAAEFEQAILAQGLKLIFSGGISALSLVISYLRSKGFMDDASSQEIAALSSVLGRLGETGSFRRCHVVIAEK